MGVGICTGNQGVPVRIGSSLRNTQDAKLESMGGGTASVAFITDWMRDGGQPLAVATSRFQEKSKPPPSIGNAGLSASFDRFTASCKD